MRGCARDFRPNRKHIQHTLCLFGAFDMMTVSVAFEITSRKYACDVCVKLASGASIICLPLRN
jgi:hypothetical protein